MTAYPGRGKRRDTKYKGEKPKEFDGEIKLNSNKSSQGKQVSWSLAMREGG